MPSDGATTCNPPVDEHKLAVTATIMATSAKVIMFADVLGKSDVVYNPLATGLTSQYDFVDAVPQEGDVRERPRCAKCDEKGCMTLEIGEVGLWGLRHRVNVNLIPANYIILYFQARPCSTVKASNNHFSHFDLFHRRNDQCLVRSVPYKDG